MDPILESELADGPHADLLLAGAPSHDDDVHVRARVGQLAQGAPEILVASVGLHAGHDADYEGVVRNAEAPPPVGHFPNGIESFRVHRPGHHFHAVRGKAESPGVVVEGDAGRLDEEGRRPQHLASVAPGRHAFAVIARSDKGQSRGRGRGDAMVVVQVAMDEVVGMLAKVSAQGPCVEPVKQRIPVLAQAEPQDRLDAPVAGRLDDLVDGLARVGRAREVGLDPGAPQGDAQIQGGFRRTRPFGIAEEMEDTHVVRQFSFP